MSLQPCSSPARALELGGCKERDEKASKAVVVVVIQLFPVPRTTKGQRTSWKKSPPEHRGGIIPRRTCTRSRRIVRSHRQKPRRVVARADNAPPFGSLWLRACAMDDVQLRPSVRCLNVFSSLSSTRAYRRILAFARADRTNGGALRERVRGNS